MAFFFFSFFLSFLFMFWFGKVLFFLFHSTFQAHGTQACGISEIGAYTLMHIAFASTFFMALSFSKPNLAFYSLCDQRRSGRIK